MRRITLERLASVNPFPNIESLDESERNGESMLARILATPRTPSATRRQRRFSRIPALAAALFVVVFVPTAIAKHYGVFGFSNEGQPINRGQLSLNDVTAIEQSGFGNDIRRLGQRAGVAFYAARSKSGGLCLSTGSASGSAPRLDHFVGCQRPVANAFPSPSKPILNLSPIKMSNPREAVSVLRLVGFAADGVARVGFVDTAGSVHSTPVVDNIYATDWFASPVPATKMVALDAEGRTVYEQSLLLGRPASG